MARESYRRDVWSHATIAGGLALAASLLEWFREWAQGQINYPVAFRIFGILIAVVFVFGVVLLISVMLERAQRRQDERLQVRLKDVGEIAGLYIDAVYQANGSNWELVGGSVLNISSTVAEGFHVAGEFFDLDLLQRGSWHATGEVIDIAQRGFVYRYGGDEGVEPHRGVGYYEFHKPALAASSVTFHGEFFADGLPAMRRVTGKRLSGSPDTYQGGEAKVMEELQNLLTQSPKLESRTSVNAGHPRQPSGGTEQPAATAVTEQTERTADS